MTRALRHAPSAHCFGNRIVHISANTVVTLTYKLYSTGDELIEETSQPISYLHGGHHGIFPKIEEALADKQSGDTCSVTLEPEDAFGEYDAELVRVETPDRFPDDVKVGMQFEESVGDDDEATRVFTVTDIADGRVVVDGNHPLAGQRLRFDCVVLDVRQATADELEHGHVHGPGAHH
jgi:FKBP-type peptidyl-prolyl cis-trans isomerase SlyD